MNTLIEKFKKFHDVYPTEERESAWDKNYKRFRALWRELILENNESDINDADIDQLVLIIDKNAKGSTREHQAVARVMIPQGVWRRMFNDIYRTPKLKETVNTILTTSGSKRADAIDYLFEINAGRKNSLTGKSVNAVNAFMAAYSPYENLHVVSLNHRRSILECYGNAEHSAIWEKSIGTQVVESNELIKELFSSATTSLNAREISEFFYERSIKEEWQNLASDDPADEEPEEPEDSNLPTLSFVLEKHLEDFLIKNWDSTELGEQYDLITDDENNLVSQQYTTDIGTIDILAKVKKQNQYVVFELKRDQSSDTTIGQISRYLGWVDNNLNSDKPAIGIIIAHNATKKLQYAVKRVPGVEIFEYRVDFDLRKVY